MGNNPKKVSVIIPNYNHATYLKKRIDSVVTQTFKNFETIVLDDHSCDGSKEIISSYLDRGLVDMAVYNDVNSNSVFKQWKKGINLASCEYVWIAESDDFADEKFLEETVQILDNNNDVGFVFTSSHVLYPTFETDFIQFQRQIFYIDKLFPEGRLDRTSFVDNYLVNNCIIPNVSSVLFRKDAFDDQILNEMSQYKFLGDWYTYLALLQRRDAYYVDKSLNSFRRTSNSFSFNYRSSDFYIDKIKIISFIKSLNRYPKEFINNKFDHLYYEITGNSSMLMGKGFLRILSELNINDDRFIKRTISLLYHKLFK